jgi:hypothetical protein
MARILSTQFQLNDSEEHLGIFLQGLEDDFYPIARRQRDASIIPVVGLCSKRKGQTVQLLSHTLNNWCCSSPLINFIILFVKPRYDRQLRLWGDHGQLALERSRVCVIHATATATEILKSLVLPGTFEIGCLILFCVKKFFLRLLSCCEQV